MTQSFTLSRAVLIVMFIKVNIILPCVNLRSEVVLTLTEVIEFRGGSWICQKGPWQGNGGLGQSFQQGSRARTDSSPRV